MIWDRAIHEIWKTKGEILVQVPLARARVPPFPGRVHPPMNSWLHYEGSRLVHKFNWIGQYKLNLGCAPWGAKESIDKEPLIIQVDSTGWTSFVHSLGVFSLCTRRKLKIEEKKGCQEHPIHVEQMNVNYSNMPNSSCLLVNIAS